jgi:hypothetical protein
MAIKSLPFLSKPAKQDLVIIGDEKSGTIALPRYDDITPNEKMFIDNEIKELPDTEQMLIKLVNTISEKTGTPVEDVWESVRNNDAIKLMKGDMEGLMALRRVQEENAGIKRIIYAAAMLIYRCPPCAEWTIKEVGNPDLVPNRLLRHLELFCIKEMNRGRLPLDELDAEEIEEATAAVTVKKALKAAEVVEETAA